MHAIFYEVNGYLNGGNPTGNSLAQRFEFWRASRHILKDRWLIGVGTGDLPRAFNRSYQEIETLLDNEHRFRAHNQIVSIFMALGILGLVWVMFIIFGPFMWRPENAFDLRFIAFILILGLSFLAEDTLESQVGQTLFTFFYCYLLLLPPDGSISEHQS
jgi:O-antigen ligase